jgi:hypothetical protein
MMAEDILQKLRGIVDGDWTENTFQDNFAPTAKELIKQSQKTVPKSQEFEQWNQMGLDLMMRGISTLDDSLAIYTFAFFPGAIDAMGQPIDFEKPWAINSILRQLIVDRKALRATISSVDFFYKFFELIKQPDEKPLYFDFFSTHIGEGFNRLRAGGVIITNQRLLSIGVDVIATTEFKHRYDIFYPDIQEKAYYGVLDFVDLENIIYVENKFGRFTKRIELDLGDIEFVKTRPQHFYGPLFFKKQLSDKVKVGRGHFKLALTPFPIKGVENGDKERQQRLYDEIESARAALK